MIFHRGDKVLGGTFVSGRIGQQVFKSGIFTVLGNDEAMSARAEIERLTEKFAKAVTGKDFAALGPFYEDRARFLPPGAPMVEGPVAIQAAQRKIIEQGLQSLTLCADDIIEAGDLIIEIGRIAVTIRPRGIRLLLAMIMGKRTFTIRGKSVVIWRRQKDDSLKIAVDTFNSDGWGF